MNKYIKPIAEFTTFSVRDIITESNVVFYENGVIVNSQDLAGEDQNMYEIYSRNSATPNTKISVFTW